MTRREALAKATLTTANSGGALLDPRQGRAFVRALKEKANLLNAMRQEIVGEPQGEINKISTGARIIRHAPENADDGYRAGAAFDSVPYVTRKIRLPWEVTEDLFHENVEREALEATLRDEMTTQFALDLEDLAVNGDTSDASADAPFLTIDDGILKQITDAAVPGRNIDGSSINGGAINKSHFFEALYALPNRYRARGGLEWLMGPNRSVSYWEHLTDRNTAAGDALLAQRTGAAGALGPLGIPIREVPAMPDDTILLSQPRNFVQVISWQVRRRRVTGETDADLAARDKRFYVFFIKQDVIIEEPDAVVRVHSLDPVV
jgi:HK97 family phage major capsid protein